MHHITRIDETDSFLNKLFIQVSSFQGISNSDQIGKITNNNVETDLSRTTEDRWEVRICDESKFDNVLEVRG